jgi:hypothetical protein
VTVPPYIDSAIPVGTLIVGEGTQGVVTLSEGPGVNINYNSSLSLSTVGAYAVFWLYKTATNTWTAWGDLAS